MTKGRDVRPLRRVHINGEHVFTAEVDVRRQIERKRRVATFVLAQPHAVDPNGRGGHDPFEVDENPLATCLRGQTKTTPVDGYKLILLVVEAMPGQPDIRMRNDDVIKRRVVELPPVRPFDEGPVVPPIPIDGKNHPAHNVGRRGHGITGKQPWHKGGSRKDSARGLHKISSVHNVKASLFDPRREKSAARSLRRASYQL